MFTNIFKISSLLHDDGTGNQDEEPEPPYIIEIILEYYVVICSAYTARKYLEVS